MAAGPEISGEATAGKNESNSEQQVKKSEESEFRNVQKLVEMFTKLNPLAKEFFPSYKQHQSLNDDNNNKETFYQFESSKANYKLSVNDNNPINRRRRNNYNQGRRRLNGRNYRAQRENSVKRTVYVSDIDQQVTEERLAALFSNCGQVVDCRICGDPHSVLRFAFVEFADEYGARAALNLGGTVLGYYPVRVLPSKTAILPVNPTFLPRSDDEREMCSRTVYCTNIDKKVSQTEVKTFFETACGEVTRIRLLGDHVHSTRIAFVEFAMKINEACVKLEEYGGSGVLTRKNNLAESAIVALNCSGMVLGTQPIRVSPSKTPVRARVAHPPLH